MLQRPIAVGLTLCRLAVVEERTHNVSLINSFTSIKAASIPGTLEPFYACALLTDGMGIAEVVLTVTQLETMEEVYSQRWQGHFSHPLQRLWLLFPIRECPVPALGRYQVTLNMDSDGIAESVFEVVAKGQES